MKIDVSFSEFMKMSLGVNEVYINLFSKEDKNKYIDDIWEKLQKTYEPMGGIKGSGFNSKEDLVENIKMIKLYRKDGNILCGFLYKDKGMRKRVATFTDGTKEAVKQLKKMLEEDFKRSIVEVSHNMLRFMEKRLPEMIKKYAIPSNKVQSIINKDIEIVDEFKYKRKVGKEYITKLLIGTEKKMYQPE